MRGPWRGSRRAAGLCAAAQHPAAAASTPPAHAAGPTTLASRAEAAWRPKHAKHRDLGVGGLAGATKPSRRPGVGARRAAHSRPGPCPEAVPSLSPHARMVRTRKAERPCCRNRQISPFWPQLALGAIGGVEALKAEVPNRNAQNVARGPAQAQHAPPQIFRRCGWKLLKLWAENPLLASIEQHYSFILEFHFLFSHSVKKFNTGSA